MHLFPRHASLVTPDCRQAGVTSFTQHLFLLTLLTSLTLFSVHCSLLTDHFVHTSFVFHFPRLNRKRAVKVMIDSDTMMAR